MQSVLSGFHSFNEFFTRTFRDLNASRPLSIQNQGISCNTKNLKNAYWEDGVIFHIRTYKEAGTQPKWVLLLSQVKSEGQNFYCLNHKYCVNLDNPFILTSIGEQTIYNLGGWGGMAQNHEMISNSINFLSWGSHKEFGVLCLNLTSWCLHMTSWWCILTKICYLLVMSCCFQPKSWCHLLISCCCWLSHEELMLLHATQP